MSDAIDEFIALPKDKQLSTLQSLSPDKQDKLLAKIKERRQSSVGTDAIKPEDRTLGNYVSEGASGIGRGVANTATGLVQSAMHPIATFGGLVDQTATALNSGYKEFKDTSGAPLPQRLGAATLVGLENAPVFGGMVQHDEEGGTRMGSPEAFGAAMEAITTLEFPAIAGELSGKAIKATPRALNYVTGTGPRALGDVVKETQNLNAKDARDSVEATRAAESKQRLAEQKHLDETLEALHETTGREIQYELEVKAAKDAADAANAKIDSDHATAVQEALEKTRQNEDLYDAQLAKAKQESKEAYQQKLSEVKEKRQKAEAARREELRKYIQKKSQIKAEHEAAQAKFEKDRAAQRKIEPTKEKLKTAWSNLRARVETAREKSLKVGNEKYSGVNQAMNGLESSPDFIGSAIGQAETTLRGSTQDTTLLKNMTEEYLGDGKKSKGRTPTYEDLQGEYSRLGNEISKGSLPGDVYKAYDNLHEAIGNEMQRMADEHGQGAQLKAARDYWRRMKQTFGKPIVGATADTAVLQDAASGLAKDDTIQTKLNLLGSFDPEIPRQFNFIQNVEKGLKALPKPVPERELVKPLVEAKAKQLPPAPGKGEPIPEPAPPGEPAIAPPDRAPIPDRPSTYVDPALPKPPDRVLPSDRPDLHLRQSSDPNAPAARTALSPRKIGEKEVQQTKSESLQKSADWIRHRGVWAGTLPFLYILKDLVHGNVGGVGNAVVEGGAIVGVTQAIASVLENPKVVEFLTKANERDVAAIPPELRGDFPQIIARARRQGINVSPALIRGVQAMSVAGVGPKTKELQSIRDKRP